MFHVVGRILGRGELGDSLGSLGYGMFGELSREHKTHSRLNFSRGKSSLLVVGAELSGLTGDTLEDVIDEGIHDGHSLLADPGVGVDLLEHLVDVGGVRLDALLAALLLISRCLGGFGGGLLAGCLRHG